MRDNLQLRLLAAQAVAREAGAMARRRFQDQAPLHVSFKGRQEHVTDVDCAVEALIIERLRSVFPDDQFLGEESGGQNHDRLWVIDPIDGTANYVRGISHFSVSIAYISGNAVQVGVVYAPIADELFSAAAGSGAWLDGKAIHVSAVANLAEAYIEIGWNLKDRVTEYCNTIQKAAGQGAAIIRAGSAALSLAHVAMGRIDGYCEQHVYAWDALAGILLVREAGGKTNPFLNTSTLIAGNAILAAPPGLIEALSNVSGISAE
ncbi:inositol monophosphatase family protein [Roseiarcaceae bacterium H3SJ34-1]|uniref:inositol monophosphatase family protein n=1 Tax=Terripilifer ovatus TaxID=3032367 RepID=UPI003AB9B35F|nr:inositol monophosphatase family protein [Roseiarcaceae bacterium H3SJ34-1]